MSDNVCGYEKLLRSGGGTILPPPERSSNLHGGNRVWLYGIDTNHLIARVLLSFITRFGHAIKGDLRWQDTFVSLTEFAT